MVILALDTATRAGSIALFDGDAMHTRVGDASVTHTERLPGELFDWLATHGRSLDAVDLLAVVTGPGSFTGLRVGISAMQGLALAAHKRVVGVPTLDALRAASPSGTGEPRLVVACQDGHRGDVFFAAWSEGREGRPDQAQPVVEPAVALPDEAVEAVRVAAGDRPIDVIGDGAVRYQDVWRRLPNVRRVTDGGPLAESAARLAARHPDRGGAPHALRPIYIRRPDAQLARDRARALRPADAPGSLDQFVVTQASTADLAAVEQLQRSTFTNPWAAEAIQWELENTDVARLYIMRERGGELVAFCACWLVFDELHVNSFAVSPVWRRQGLATRLLREVFRDARASGATSATLEVRASNIAARDLYEKLGFSVEGVRRDYYQAPREDALILWNRHLASRVEGGASAPP